MRRFAFIEVESPPNEVIQRLITGSGELVAGLLPIRELIDIGPALFIDGARYATRRLEDRGVTPSRVLLEVFRAYFLPQLDQLDDAGARALHELIVPAFAAPEQATLRRIIRTVLGSQAPPSFEERPSAAPSPMEAEYPPIACAVMRGIVGDRPFNQRFLKVVLQRCGFEDVVGATTADELLLEAADGADFIVFDPVIIESATRTPVDIVSELAGTFPRDRMLVLSPSSAVLEWARSYGIEALRKRSLFQVSEIQAAVQRVVDRLEVRLDVRVDRDEQQAPSCADLAPRGFDMDELMRPRAARATPIMLEPAVGQ